MNDDTLISLVQNYEEIYNLKHPDYSNQQRRNDIWEEIAEIMKRTDKQCRERWTRLRDNHRKALNLRKTKSGQAASKMKPPKFEKELSFLSPYLLEDEIRQSNFPSPGGIADGNEENDDDDRNTDNDGQDSVNDSNLSTQSSVRSSYKSRTKRLKKYTASEEPSAVFILKGYLETKKITDIPSHQDDTLINFFLNMAETVKSFPIKDQVELKSKIFQLVNSVEMRIVNEKTAYQLNSNQ